MALPLPNLDDRRWSDLVDEGRALVPRHAPRWTDHNAHDPGITLVELFAWIAEQGLYRLNQVPERHRLKFLRLVGFSPWPSRPARTVIALAPETGTQPFAVPAGALFEGDLPGAAPAPVFRTRRAVLMQPARLRALLIDRGDGTLRDGTADLMDEAAVQAFGPAPGMGAALYLGFEELSTDLALSLAVHVQGPRADDDERERLRVETAAQRADCRPRAPWKCDGAVEAAPEIDQVPRHHSARLLWEGLTGTSPETWTALSAVTGPEPPPPGSVRDNTRAFTLDGEVELNLPASSVLASLGPIAEPLRYVRARLVSGSWDAAPVLTSMAVNGAWADQRAPLWREFVIASSVPPPASPPPPGAPTRLSMGLDTAGVIQSLTFGPGVDIDPEFHVFDYEPPGGGSPGRLALGADLVARGHGFPDQEVALPGAPAIRDSTRVYTHDGQSWQPWAAQADLDASRRTDFHIALDAHRGRLLGGDGERGRVLPAAVPVLVSGELTDAEIGNVPAGTLTRPVPGVLNSAWLSPAEALDDIVTQPQPAAGGAATESVGSAARRAAETLLAHERLVALAQDAARVTLDQLDPEAVRGVRAPLRAYTLLDYERLALDVPGTRVARARAFAGHHPAWPCPGIAGWVTW